MNIRGPLLVASAMLMAGACDINQPDDRYVGASDPMIELRLASPAPTDSTTLKMTSRDGSTFYVADTALVDEGGFETVDFGGDSEGGVTLTVQLDPASAARVAELHEGEHVALLLGSRLINAVRVVEPSPGMAVTPSSVASTVTISVDDLSAEEEHQLASYVKSHWPRSDGEREDG